MFYWARCSCSESQSKICTIVSLAIDVYSPRHWILQNSHGNGALEIHHQSTESKLILVIFIVALFCGRGKDKQGKVNVGSVFLQLIGLCTHPQESDPS